MEEPAKSKINGPADLVFGEASLLHKWSGIVMCRLVRQHKLSLKPLLQGHQPYS